MIAPRFSIIEHPADIGVEASGDSMEEAFVNAAVGLMSIIIDLQGVSPSEHHRVEIDASDRDQMLVRWLSEVLFLYDGRGFVTCTAKIHQLSETSLQAEVWGEQLDQQKHSRLLDVKAVTYHQLMIRKTSSGVSVRVFFDI